jgi:hypothetical protein
LFSKKIEAGEQMLKKIALTMMSVAVLITSMIHGCRNPEEAWTPPDDWVFDGSVEDDAGPGECCPEGTPDLFNNAYSPYYGGEEDVRLEVVNISYFRCPHCAHFADTAQQIWNDRDDFMAHVRLYFHHYPFNHQSAWDLHALTVAAGQQGMENFWSVHDFIYGGISDNDPSVYYSMEEILAFCDDVLYLDMERLEEDRADEQTYAFLEWDKGQSLAQSVGGTPSVFICGEKESYGSLESIVDGYLNP